MTFLVSEILPIFLLPSKRPWVLLSVILCITGCPQNESRLLECASNPCQSSTCPSAPTAHCFPDYCDNCTSRYYYNDREVTDTCCKLIMCCTTSKCTFYPLACSDGLQPVSCAPSCLATCQNPEPSCPTSSCIPGCGCPDDTVYDQIKNECVTPSSCGKNNPYNTFLSTYNRHL